MIYVAVIVIVSALLILIYTLASMYRDLVRIENLVEELRESEEMAWILLANSHGGNWNLTDKEWKKAAIKWRDEHFARYR